MVNALGIINEINERLGWPQLATIESPDVTNEQRKVVKTLNRVLETMQGVKAWSLLRKDGTITLVASEVSDLDPDDNPATDDQQYVTATKNSKNVTVANMSFTDVHKTRAFQVSGDKTVYRIDDVLSPTEIVLNLAWISDSIAVSDEKTFTIAADLYSLPTDYDRPTDDIRNFFGPYKIKPRNPNAFVERRTVNPGITLGEPNIFTIYGMNEGQTTELIHFHPYPKNARMLTFSYQSNHPVINSDNDKILYHQRYMEFIINAVYQICLDAYEDSAKADRALINMMREYNWQTDDITSAALRIRPLNEVRMSMKRAHRYGGHRINWGSYFDKAGNVYLDY
jgi:hypothetical protein